MPRNRTSLFAIVVAAGLASLSIGVALMGDYSLRPFSITFVVVGISVGLLLGLIDVSKKFHNKKETIENTSSAVRFVGGFLIVGAIALLDPRPSNYLQFVLAMSVGIIASLVVNVLLSTYAKE